MSRVGELFILAAALFSLLASIGVLRFQGVYNRLHASSLASTFGILFASLAVLISFRGSAEAWKSLLVPLFFYLTAPVGANYLTQAAYRLGVRPSGETQDVEQAKRASVGKVERESARG